MAPAFATTTTTPMATATTTHATPLATVAVAAAAASPTVADAVQGMADVERRPESEGGVERRFKSGSEDWSSSTKPTFQKPLNPAFQKPLNPRRAARQTARGAAEVAGCKPTLVTLVW